MDLERIQTEYALLERNRKFAGVFRIARSVDQFERRLSPHIDSVKVEVNWESIEKELTAGSEKVAFDWMKAIWTGELQAGSQAISMLWMTDCKIKEAIVCALAESTFANYVLDESYRTPRSA